METGLCRKRERKETIFCEILEKKDISSTENIGIVSWSGFKVNQTDKKLKFVGLEERNVCIEKIVHKRMGKSRYKGSTKKYF